MDARIDLLDTGRRATCNTWLIGDDEEVIVVDPGSDAAAVLEAVDDRDILAVICTHGHERHVKAALAVAARDESPVALHPDDLLTWREVHPDEDPEIEMAAGGRFEVSDVVLEVIHTPGHSPGSVCLYCEDLDAVFSGDTLIATGPAPHDKEFPDLPRQFSAIGEELLTLPGQTRVLPGHGDELTAAQAEKQFDTWVATSGDLPETTE